MLYQHTLRQRGLITTGFHLPYDPKLKDRARILRKNMTPPEKRLWNEFLRNLDFPVLRQKPIDHYIVDFYCPKLKLVIEVDGDSHCTKVGKEYDEVRTSILEGYGLYVLRVTNDEVMQKLETVIKRIQQFSQSI